jgi:predicted lipid-binding transport protein (Tim44 family)
METACTSGAINHDHMEEEKSDDEVSKFTAKMSFLEIYNKEVSTLLDDGKKHKVSVHITDSSVIIHFQSWHISK